MKRNNTRTIAGLLAAAILLLLPEGGQSQTLTDTIRSEMAAINKAYDSAFYLTFNIEINYKSDTVFAGTDSADFTVSHTAGIYTFYNNKALYKLDNIEYLQNDSFAIAVYNDEKFMLVGRAPTTRPGNFIPVNAMLDSMLRNLQVDYTCGFQNHDSVRLITFHSPDSSNTVYKNILLEYDPLSYHLHRVWLKLVQEDEQENSAGMGSLRLAEMELVFKNYRVEQVNESVFSESRYIFFDGPDDIKPVGLYKDYVIYKNY